MPKKMETESAIEIESLSVAFAHPQPTIAFTDVSLSISRGAFVSILGPSGCGKSTLLRAIGGFVSPTSGTIRCFDRAVTLPSPERAILFQNDSVFPWKTSLDNVAFALECRGYDRSAAQIEATKWLTKVGLGGFDKFYPSQLSGGMIQRVALARTFASAAPILLLDEPFRALDRRTRNEVWHVLLDLWKERNVTILFVSHDADEAMILSDQIIMMDGRPGRVIASEVVALPRPRSFECLLKGEGIDLQRRIYQKVMNAQVK
jgi:NitT/TauT family transport system ATP-binding protein